MRTRVITAVVMVAVLIPFFIFSDTLAFPILLSFLGALGVYEMQTCIGAGKTVPSILPSLLVAAGLPFLSRHCPGQVLPFSFLIFFLLIILSYGASVFSKGKYPVDIAALSCSTTAYISFGFSSVLLLRDLPHGEAVCFLSFVIPWVTDTFAYFCGRAFGKHKLIPEVSPKKTVEGSVGGTLCALLLTLLYGFLIGRFTSLTPNYLGIAVTAAAGSLLSQCGDLMMSLVKRKFGVKDYGKLFPGHGGVLDRFDSVLCTAPALYFLTAFLPSLSLFK